MGIHFTVLAAFTADLVTLAALGAFFSTAFMTPTATVCLMSRTAKRPGDRTKRDGKQRKTDREKGEMKEREEEEEGDGLRVTWVTKTVSRP